MNVLDVKLKAGKRFELKVQSGHTASLFTLSFTAETDTTLLFLSGEPVQEPIAA